VARRLAVVLGVLLAFVAGALAAIHVAVGSAARGRVYPPTQVEPREVAIVFGAALGSQLLRDRVATGAQLFHAGKVKHLLLTGDNRRRSYDEPAAMRRIALELGVPASALTLDYAGRRTYDSCVRARRIFEVDGASAILVTQQFHLPRALYLCDRLGLAGAIGVSADRHRYPWHLVRHRLRELLADAKAWYDVHLGQPSVVGGPALPIHEGTE
jgi:vancomycin permeability regulator SanA